MSVWNRDPHSEAPRNWPPIFALLFAATLWGLFWYPLRWLESRGVEELWAVLLIYSSTMLVAVPMLWRHWPQFRGNPTTLLIIGLANGWCNVSFFLAILDGTVVRVVLLFYLSPVWSVLLGRIILGERLSARAWTNWTLAIIGALIMLADPGVGFPVPQSTADWLAVSSGLAFSLGNVMTRRAAHVAVGAKTAAAWSGCFLIAVVWQWIVPAPAPPFDSTSLSVAISLGIFGIVIMTSCVLYGVSRLPVYQSSVIMLFELVVAAISAQWLTDEVVTTREWIGGSLILIAAWLSAHDQKRPPPDQPRHI